MLRVLKHGIRIESGLDDLCEPFALASGKRARLFVGWWFGPVKRMVSDDHLAETRSSLAARPDLVPACDVTGSIGTSASNAKRPRRL